MARDAGDEVLCAKLVEQAKAAEANEKGWFDRLFAIRDLACASLEIENYLGQVEPEEAVAKLVGAYYENINRARRREATLLKRLRRLGGATR